MSPKELKLIERQIEQELAKQWGVMCWPRYWRIVLKSNRSIGLPKIFLKFSDAAGYLNSYPGIDNIEITIDQLEIIGAE